MIASSLVCFSFFPSYGSVFFAVFLRVRLRFHGRRIMMGYQSGFLYVLDLVWLCGIKGVLALLFVFGNPLFQAFWLSFLAC